MRLESRRSARAFVALAAVVPALAVTAFTAPSSASPAKKQTVSVYPDHGLVDGQPVIVRWSGFAKNQPVALRLCEQGATAPGRCANYAVSGGRLSDVVSTYATSDATGAGSETMTVAVTDANHGLAGAAEVRCDNANPCDIVVTDSFTSLTSASLARASVRFALVSECPPAGVLTLDAGGSDVADLAMGAWGARLCHASTPVSVGYVAKNDMSGRMDYQCEKLDAAIVEYKPDFATDACPAANPGGKDTQRPAVRMAPITLSPVVIAFNMRNQSAINNSRIDRLVLTPDLLAEIFTGRLYNGQDPRIKALNPGITLPVNIKAIARADQSGINYTLTRFLDAAAPKAYAAGGRLFQSGPTDSLASVNGLDLRTGGTAVAKAVLFPENDPRSTAWGYLGVMDASQAARFGLSTVTLKLGTGGETRLVSPTNAATLAAVRGAAADRFGYFNLPAIPRDPQAWPMVSIGYVVPPGDGAEPLAFAATATAVSYFIDAKRGQSADVLPAGYVPLPVALAAQARKTLSFAAPDPQPTAAPQDDTSTGSNQPSTPTVPVVNPTLPTLPTSGDSTVDMAAAEQVSVFDRDPSSSSTSWLWLVLLTGAGLATVYLVRASKGAVQ